MSIYESDTAAVAGKQPGVAADPMEVIRRQVRDGREIVSAEYRKLAGYKINLDAAESLLRTVDELVGALRRYVEDPTTAEDALNQRCFRCTDGTIKMQARVCKYHQAIDAIEHATGRAP